jgi:hypothetical protein
MHICPSIVLFSKAESLAMRRTNPKPVFMVCTASWLSFQLLEVGFRPTLVDGAFFMPAHDTDR